MDPALAAQMSQAVAEKVLRYRRDASGWKTCREGNGVTVSWRPSTEFPGNLYRGEGVVDAAPRDVWAYVKPFPGSLRETWDENVSSFEVIESISDTLCVTRTATPSAAMKLISPRDFVDLALATVLEDGALVSTAANLEHPLCPPRPGFVRGRNHPCGCFCEPVPGGPHPAVPARPPPGSRAGRGWWPSSRRTWAGCSRSAWWTASSPAAWPASTPTCAAP